MMHEAMHQLNRQVARVSPAQWLEEGIATYISTSRIVDGRLRPGLVDTNTYPVWWRHVLAVAGDRGRDRANGTVIPLRVIVGGSGGPDMDEAFNLYYLHWWTLTHFLVHHDGGAYVDGLGRLLRGSQDVAAFERHIGPIPRVEREWYAYVLELKKTLKGRRTPPVVVE